MRKREGESEAAREKGYERRDNEERETRGVFIAAVVKAVRPASVRCRFDTYRVFGN